MLGPAEFKPAGLAERSARTTQALELAMLSQWKVGGLKTQHASEFNYVAADQQWECAT